MLAGLVALWGASLRFATPTLSSEKNYMVDLGYSRHRGNAVVSPPDLARMSNNDPYGVEQR